MNHGRGSQNGDTSPIIVQGNVPIKWGSFE